ncbi:fructosamine kinase [Chondrocystis sp. NIES-4102]|nr:fructosamine kinase [Chondrocystis sp. NIES-4102]
MWTQIAQAISQTTKNKFAIAHSKTVSGGCINQGYQISGDGQEYFVKLNQASQIEMFVAESIALTQINATKTITVPQPVCWGIAANSSYLVLQWLDLGRGNSQSWMAMGRQLALLHRQGINDSFGWERNNTIGSTPQVNTWTNNWADFFAEYRIGYQLDLAKRRGGNFPDRHLVVNAVRNKLIDHQPPASLLHGDLWSGNAAIAKDGTPVILDPATYYGDRETDLAMTELFGGFPPAFYQGYNEAWELESGYQQRKSIYNLYHVLNHFNLFGGGYAQDAQRRIKQIIS